MAAAQFHPRRGVISRGLLGGECGGLPEGLEPGIRQRARQREADAVQEIPPGDGSVHAEVAVAGVGHGHSARNQRERDPLERP